MRRPKQPLQSQLAAAMMAAAESAHKAPVSTKRQLAKAAYAQLQDWAGLATSLEAQSER